jgi:Ion channel
MALDERSRYGIVLLLLIVSVVVTIAAGGATWALALTAATQGACVVLALGGRRGDWGFRALVVVIVAGTVAGTILVNGRVGRGLLSLLQAGILAALPVIIAVRLRKNLYVSFQTVLGAVSVYLVIGMVFSAVDSALSALAGAPFFAGGPTVSSAEYTYFSFITLATVGYGDYVPAAGLPRAAAVTEALLGQLYLVTIVALLVGNVGRSRAAGG